jgi:cell fate regulator YaaT (PSP1 superfamily)
MSDKRQPNVVGVRFCKVGKIYHFDASDLENVQLGDIVIVDTARGTQLGEVVQLVKKASETDGGLKKSTGEPTPWILFSVAMAANGTGGRHSLPKPGAGIASSGVKVASAEYSFDGSRLTILYSTETEEKVDLKSLRPDMQRAYFPARWNCA